MVLVDTTMPDLVPTVRQPMNCEFDIAVESGIPVGVAVVEGTVPHHN